MAGFKDNSYNIGFETGLFEKILEQLISCSKEMKADCMKTGDRLFNNENKITNRLTEKYLNKRALGIRFIPQAPENYDSENDSYKGVVDLKVVSRNHFDNDTIYYSVECKRIDGKAKLNREYVTNGVARFVVSPFKYTSRDKRNIMFGYIVGIVDIQKNIKKIEDLQKKLLNDIASEKFILTNGEGSEYYLYSCKYTSQSDYIELKHLFYNFADVMCG